MAKKQSQFRRLTDKIASGDLLTPHLERELVTRGEGVWPEEYAIRVYNKERQFDGFFHPSSHADAAELQLFYEFNPEYKTYRPALSAGTIMTFQVGSAYHALIQSMLIELGFTTPEEVEVSFVDKTRWCSGTMDIRRLTLPSGATTMVEIKSAGWTPKEVPLNYQKQFQVYMDLGDDEPQEEGLMLFLQKTAPHNFREFRIKRDEIMLHNIYRKWDRVREALEFNDPSMLQYPCHEVDSKAHQDCPARFLCRLGPPTGERRPPGV